MIGVIAPKGGLGASTLTLNLAISYAQRVKSEVIAAELRPGHGSWAQDLGYNSNEGLNNLLKAKPFEIRNNNVETELVRTTYNGVRLLLADSEISDVDLVGATAQLEAVVRILPFLAPMVLLDIGVPVIPKLDRVLAFCDEIMLITEPFPASLRSTKRYMQELGNCGFGKSKLLTVVMINRIRADIQLTITQVQESLGITVAQVIPPVPEVAYQAALQYLPIVKLQPDGLIAQQFKRLAEIIAQRRK
jgi:pilus assembly protein CpaE